MSFLPLSAVLEAFILASSCSLDAFAASFAYGSQKIKIPFLSNQIINLICAAVLGIALWIGGAVKEFLPQGLTAVICFGILLVLGIAKLLDGVTKSVIKKHSDINKEIKFSLFNFRFILNLYAEPEKADADNSKSLSSAEAVALAISLSLDGIAVGFGAAIGSADISMTAIASLITNTAALALGCCLGNKAARKLPFDLSWLSGVILIGLAVTKLL